MNYIKQINAFYQRQETNQLSSGAANLWHTLMHINNRAGWVKAFTVAATVLCSKANLADSTFKRARMELRDKGYIHYESRGGNRAARYQMVSLEQSKENGKMDHNRGLRVEERAKKKNSLDDNPVPLFKQNETKQKDTTAAAGAMDFFQKNIGVMSPYIKSDLVKWVDVMGESLVMVAMKRALERGKENWGYMKGILQAWSDKGFTTVKEIESERLEFRRKGNKEKSRLGRVRNKEVVPDWFHEREKPGEKQEEKVETVETVAEARERKKLGELIAAMASG